MTGLLDNHHQHSIATAQQYVIDLLSNKIFVCLIKEWSRQNKRNLIGSIRVEEFRFIKEISTGLIVHCLNTRTDSYGVFLGKQVLGFNAASWRALLDVIENVTFIAELNNSVSTSPTRYNYNELHTVLYSSQFSA